MALARVVTFEGVSKDRVEQMKSEMEGGQPPEGLNATEVMILHDGSDKSLAIVFFDNEEDYAEGDRILGSMPADETPGTRTGVQKYDVAVRMTP
jgi:hypothetical protein